MESVIKDSQKKISEIKSLAEQQIAVEKEKTLAIVLSQINSEIGTEITIDDVGGCSAYDRVIKAISDKKIKIKYLQNDVQYALFEGSNGNEYKTSFYECSCPDFRYNRIPCKHIFHFWLYLCPEMQKLISKHYEDINNIPTIN